MLLVEITLGEGWARQHTSWGLTVITCVAVLSVGL